MCGPLSLNRTSAMVPVVSAGFLSWALEYGSCIDASTPPGGLRLHTLSAGSHTAQVEHCGCGRVYRESQRAACHPLVETPAGSSQAGGVMVDR